MLKKILIILLFLLLCVLAYAGFKYYLTTQKQHTNTPLTTIYQKYKNVSGGTVAQYIPELAKVNPALFGIAIVTVKGEIETIGDANIPFAIESATKPFVYALALQDNGEKFMADKIGHNATGHKFNSIIAIEERPDHIQNPSVNAGAIQITSYIKGTNGADKWNRVLNIMQQFSDGKIYLGDTVYQSEMATNQRNRAIAELMSSYQLLDGDPIEALDRYTKACSMMVTAKQLAIMGATLANKGVNPITHQQVISGQYARDIVSDMLINGLYDNSGIWFWKVGLPAKSGVSGAILAIVPNKMAIVVFSPPLDEIGNSVKGQLVIEELSRQWKLHLLEND